MQPKDTDDKNKDINQNKKQEQPNPRKHIEFAELRGRLEGICQILSKDMYLHYDSVEEIFEIAKNYVENNPNDKEEIETIHSYFLKIESLLKYSLDKKAQKPEDDKLPNSTKVNPYEKMVKKFQ